MGSCSFVPKHVRSTAEARTFEQGASKRKTAHRKGHVSLEKLDDLSSPGSAKRCRQMPVIKGKKTLQTCKNQQCLRSWNGFKVSKKASNGLYFMITSDQRPHHSAAKPWSRCRSGVSQCSNVGCVHVKMEQRSYAACRGKDLSCSTTHAIGCTCKSRGMLPGGDQTVATIANDERLQVRVRKGTPPEGRST